MPDRRITLLVTSDEETGSGTSRPLIEAEAVATRRSSCSNPRTRRMAASRRGAKASQITM